MSLEGFFKVFFNTPFRAVWWLFKRPIETCMQLQKASLRGFFERSGRLGFMFHLLQGSFQ